MAKSNKSFVEKRSKQLVVIAIALIAVVGISYAWLTLVLSGTKSNKITAGNLVLNLDDEGDGVNLEGAAPVSDEVGKEYDTYDFTLTNTGNIDAAYTIYLDNAAITEGAEFMLNNAIRYSLVKQTEDSEGVYQPTTPTATIASLTDLVPGSITGDARNTATRRIIDTGTISKANANGKGNKIKYQLGLWIASTADNAMLFGTAGTCSNTEYTTEADCRTNAGTWTTRTVPKEFAAKIRIEASQTGIPAGTNINYETGKTIPSGTGD